MNLIHFELSSLMIVDQHKLHHALAKLKKKKDNNREQVLENINQKIITAKAKIEQRKQQHYNLSYPDLPVCQKKEEIFHAIKNHQVVIIAGETGSGKTTQIPKICLEAGLGIHGTIGHTQPRRISARSIANRLSEELGTPMGTTVGYKVRFTDQSQDATLIKLMTDGILLAEIKNDPLLYQYDAIIIDEAHERSLNIDFLLGYLHRILPKRPDLKVIITSATLDHQRFSQHFNQAPIIEVSGRTYPVEIRYRPFGEEENSDQIDGIINAVDELYAEKRGDILVFLSGEKEIRDTADALQKLNLSHTEILPLFARLSVSEQNRIFQLSAGRRIILATNVAETSLTVPGIKYVIDTGLARISRYSVRTKVQRLPIEAISQASANQRAGRCGRVSEGICIRLYSEQDYLSRDVYTEPEILRTNLASVILQMISLGLGDIQAFPFIQAPDKRNIQDGIRLLEELGALQPSNHHYQLTQLGKQLAQFPVDPRLGRMIIEGKKMSCVKEIMIITAALSIQDPRERPIIKQQAADEKHQRFQHKESDFLSYINLWHYITEQQQLLSTSQFRKLCQKEFLNYLRIREWQDVYTQLRQVMKELGFAINSLPADYQSVHIALLSGLLSHIGQKDYEKNEYLGARNIRFSLYPGSSLFKKLPKWCVVAELVDTTKLWGRIAGQIQPEWLEPLAEHLVKKSYSEPFWSKKQGAILAKEKVTLYGLPIVVDRTINFGKIDEKVCRELFIRHALVQGEWTNSYAFFKKNTALLDEVEVFEHKSRRKDIVVDDDTLFDFYNKKIPDHIISCRHFDKWWKKEQKTLPDLLTFDKNTLIREDSLNTFSSDNYPDIWHNNNIVLPLTYHFDPGNQVDGVTIHIPLDILNQISIEGFDWTILGFRLELIIALIRSLPKNLRRNFVPAPNYAEAFLARVEPYKQPLLDVLENELRKMTGVTVSRGDWNMSAVPAHLMFTFSIEDSTGQIIKIGKDIDELKKNLTNTLQHTLSKKINLPKATQSTNDAWVFGDIEQCSEQKQGSFTIKAYPALIADTKNRSVSLKIFDTPEQQHHEMRKGVRYLIFLNIPSPIKFLHEKLPNKAKLALYFNPFGTVLDLIDDCIHCAIDSFICKNNHNLVWNEQDYNYLLNTIKGEVNERVVDIAKNVEKILTLAFAINKKLKGKIDFSLALALNDIKRQLDHLIYRGFVTETSREKLPDLYRYLQAIEKRLEKLAQDPHRDRAFMIKIEEVQNEYKKVLAKYPDNDNLHEIRWMIEELRVSFFAQQLGTQYPISEKRILQALQQIAK